MVAVLEVGHLIDGDGWMIRVAQHDHQLHHRCTTLLFNISIPLVRFSFSLNHNKQHYYYFHFFLSLFIYFCFTSHHISQRVYTDNKGTAIYLFIKLLPQCCYNYCSTPSAPKNQWDNFHPIIFQIGKFPPIG